MKKILPVLLMCWWAGSVSAQQRYTISGYITDEKSSETIIGATVYDQATRHGAISNAFGFYSLTLGEGSHNIQYSYVGYAAQNLTLTLTKDTVINIKLSENTQLGEIVVAAHKEETGISSTGMGSMDIPVRVIEHTPSILGETDVVKTVQFAPGVQQGVGGSSAIFVRGGGGDENLILLDGSPVYKIDHCFGFFSVFTPEAVKKVSFYKSSFPARYNGRASSVLDVRTKDGDMQNFHGSFSLGLLTSRFTFEGPIKKDKTSFMISGRTTYIHLLAAPAMKAFMDGTMFSYWFYDVNAKINHKFSDKDRLFVSFYNGIDRFTLKDKSKHSEDNPILGDDGQSIVGYDTETYTTNDKYVLNWGNTLATIRWNHVFSSKVFANITAAYNRFGMKMGGEQTYKYTDYYDFHSSYSKSQIRDYSVAVDWDYMPGGGHNVKFGVNATFHKFSPEASISKYKTKSKDYNQDTTLNSPRGADYDAVETALYAEDDWKITSRLHVTPALVYSMFNVDGKTYGNFMPRLSVKYLPLEWLIFKASYTRMSQCVHLLTSSILSMPTDIWVPVTKNIEPEISQQWSVGAYCTNLPGWEFSVEAYYKTLDNVLEYKDGMSYMGFSDAWQNLVAEGKGTSKGVEFLVQRTRGRATGWISYTLSKAEREFSKESGINAGQKFPFTYDRPHCINIVYNQKFNDRIDFDATWTFHSGALTTMSNAYETVWLPKDINSRIDNYYDEKGIHHSFSDSREGMTPYVEHRNNFRLPSSHVLSVGVNFHKQKKHCERIWNFSVYNLYCAHNPMFAQRWDYERGHDYISVTSILPAVPSFTLTYKF